MQDGTKVANFSARISLDTKNPPAVCEKITDGGHSVPGKLANVEIFRLSVNLQLVLHSPGLLKERAIPRVLRGVRLDGDQAEDVLMYGTSNPAGELRCGEVEARVDVLSVNPGEEGVGTWPRALGHSVLHVDLDV